MKEQEKHDSADLLRLYREAVLGYRMRTRAVDKVHKFTDDEGLKLHQMGKCIAIAKLAKFFEKSAFKVDVERLQKVVNIRCLRCFGKTEARDFLSFRLPSFSEAELD